MTQRKALFTLDIDHYAPEIRALTEPLQRHWAERIGAEYIVITERRHLGWPVAYEKLQIYDLAREMHLDWAFFLDADALVHPETPDWSFHLPADTVAHNGSDLASIRWRVGDDPYFRRDGRAIGSCNWCTVASALCLDLWHPLEDLSLEEAVARIHPTVSEARSGLITPEHLIDDYVLSRNIARFGLRFTTLIQLQRELGLPDANFYFHEYAISNEEKVAHLRATLDAWDLGTVTDVPFAPLNGTW